MVDDIGEHEPGFPFGLDLGDHLAARGIVKLDLDAGPLLEQLRNFVRKAD